MSINNYKVCILAAGKGLRLGELTKTINKCLLPINGKAILSHILDKFNHDIEIVIAVGHESDKIKEYVLHAHPHRKIVFCDIENYDGIGSGPGKSLLECKKYLNCPFIMTTGDTIVEDSIPEPDYNWMGVSKVKDKIERYCSISIENGCIEKLVDKKKCENKHAFIGLAGIKNYCEFWKSLEQNGSLIDNELQVSNGFNGLLNKTITPEIFKWHDTGTVENYFLTKGFFEKSGNFDFSKVDEFIYFVNDRVIKYFSHSENVKKRYERSKFLKDLCPDILVNTKNFISYKHIKGDTLYSIVTPKITSDFFTWCKTRLWKDIEYNNDRFKHLCNLFYKEKTLKRLDSFYKKYKNFQYKEIKINNKKCESIENLLEMIDWKYITNGIPTNFHGDLQFDNVLKTSLNDKFVKSFQLIDWRGDFAGATDVGDIYYDLSKLYGGLILPYHLIKENRFDFKICEDTVMYNFETSHMLQESKRVYENTIIENGYDLNKIKIITSLIFLNMSPLHHYPFDHMLYHLSRRFLDTLINNDS